LQKLHYSQDIKCYWKQWNFRETCRTSISLNSFDRCQLWIHLTLILRLFWLSTIVAHATYKECWCLIIQNLWKISLYTRIEVALQLLHLLILFLLPSKTFPPLSGSYDNQACLSAQHNLTVCATFQNPVSL
jgi:hypothetical protein